MIISPLPVKMTNKMSYQSFVHQQILSFARCLLLTVSILCCPKSSLSSVQSEAISQQNIYMLANDRYKNAMSRYCPGEFLDVSLTNGRIVNTQWYFVNK